MRVAQLLLGKQKARRGGHLVRWSLCASVCGANEMQPLSLSLLVCTEMAFAGNGCVCVSQGKEREEAQEQEGYVHSGTRRKRRQTE